MAAKGYSRTQVVLHWTVVALVALQFLFHDGISDAFRDGLRGDGFVLTVPAVAHMVAGASVLLLAFWRINLRREHGVPPPPEGEAPWQRAVARGTHLAFYAVLILLPVTGGIAWGQGSREPGEVHEILSNVLLALIALHVAGAAYGQWVRRDGTLARMLRPER